MRRLNAAMLEDNVLTSFTVISIPVIILCKASFKFNRKLSIAIVLCLSIFMIMINLIRGIFAAAQGTNVQTWNTFWVQLETSVSVISACPLAFRNLFVAVNHGSRKRRRAQIEAGQRSFLGKFWKRTRPALCSNIVAAPATDAWMSIRGNQNKQTNVELRDDIDFAFLTNNDWNDHSTSTKSSTE